MAEIFVGSVAVGVVPDARGWNTKLRAQLVPSSEEVGREVGNNVSSGIVKSLDDNKARMARAGEANASAFSTTFRKRIEAAMKALPAAEIKADSTKAERKVAELRAKMIELLSKDIDVNLSSKEAMAKIAEIDAGLKILQEDANIKVRFDARTARAELTKFRAEVSRASGGGGGGILGTLSRLVPGFGPGLGGGGIGAGGAGQAGQAASAAASGGGGLLNPWTIGIGAAGVGAALPFLGQAAGGLLTGGLGTGLAGLGVLGALYGNIGKQVTVTNQQMRASHLQLAAATQRQTAAQDNLNKLESSGKATAGQLAAAHASLDSAMAGVATAQGNLNKLQQQNQEARQTARVKDMQQAWTDLGKDAKKSIAEIGAAFVPVMTNIFKTADKVMKQMTPVFADVEHLIAGPFQTFVDTILKAFAQPAVQQSIRDVANAFVEILKAFTPDIPGIMKSFAEAISRMAQAIALNPKATADFINFLFQVIIAIIDVIAWLTVAANWLESHWPTIWKYAGAVIMGFVDVFKVGFAILNGVFGFFLSLIQGHWSDAWNHLKDAGKRIWNLIKDEAGRVWDAILGVIDSITGAIGHNIANRFDNIRHGIAHVWGDIASSTYRVLADLGHNIAAHFDQIRHNIAGWGQTVLHTIRIIWNDIYGATIGALIRIGHNIEVQFNNMKHWILTFFNDAIHWLPRAGHDIINGLWNGLKAAWNFLWGWFTRIDNTIIGFFSGAVNWLKDAGGKIIHGLLAGIWNAMRNVASWINQMVVQPIISAVKRFFHISSPSQVMMGIGKNLIQGLIHGLLTSGRSLAGLVSHIFKGWPQALASFVSKGLVDIAKLPKAALNALGKVSGFLGGLWKKIAGGGGGGVQQWAGMVMQALAMLHLPGSLLGQVLYQMQTESGGNPNAINLTDINAQMGDPSRGLLQVIGKTFAAFHVPGTSGNIYDPLANIAAAINYALHRYGPTLMSGGMGMGSGHGYDTGGWLPPGVTLAYNMTGRPERVLTWEQAQGGIGGTEYHAHFDGLTGAAIESHVRTAFQAMSITQGNLGRQGRRT